MSYDELHVQNTTSGEYPAMSTLFELSAPLRILVAGDPPELRGRLELALRQTSCLIDFAESGEEVLHALDQGSAAPSLVIVDLTSPQQGGLTTVRKVRLRNPSVPMIIFSGDSSGLTAAEARRHGANHCLVLNTPVSQQQLRQALDELLPAAPGIPSPKTSESISSKSGLNLKAGNWIRQIEPLMKRLATSEVPVLLQGETGVGKEVLARYIHEHSPRSHQIFLKLNCAALPSELVESELFGYERGAFTGAFKSYPGKFELADGGTILLDEIGDMDLKLQSKLLQVLQDHEFHRIGSKEPTRVNVRVIAATHRELETQIENGEFRQDLYYRLNVVNIVIPPLRERLDEIIPLASFFLRKHVMPGDTVPEIGCELKTALVAHGWPGNIRELENVMRRYLVVRSPEAILEQLNSSRSKLATAPRRGVARASVEDQSQWAAATAVGGSTFSPLRRVANDGPVSFPQVMAETEQAENSELVKLDHARKAAEIELITKALFATQWNRKRAAANLGIDYKALLYKMKKLGID